MTVDRTAANRDTVIDFRKEALGGEVDARDPGDLSGIYFHSDQPGIGRLHVGEDVLADFEHDVLIRRLEDHRVLGYLRAGQSVTVLSQSTAVVP